MPLADALGAHLTHEPGATPVGRPAAPAAAGTRRAAALAAGRGAADGGRPGRARGTGDWSPRSPRARGWSPTASPRRRSPTRATGGASTSPRSTELVAWATDGLAADLSVLVDVERRGGRGPAGRGGRPGRRGPDGAARARRSRRGSATASWPRPRRTPRAGSSSTARRRSAQLTAHIVASVRERLGERTGPSPVSGRNASPCPRSSPASWRRRRRWPRCGRPRPTRSTPTSSAARPATAAWRPPTDSPAALLCPDGGCGECATCRAALAGTDPDLHVVRRSGASVSTETLRQVVDVGPAATAARGAPGDRRPRRAPGALDRAPVLLKTLEEPPGRRSSCCWPTTSRPTW